MTYGALLFVECWRIRHQCYFSRRSPHDRTAVTSFSQLSCHSNEVWQIGQIVWKLDSDLCSLCAVFSISAAISDRMTRLSTLVDTMMEKTSLQQFFLLFIGFCALSLYGWSQDSFHAHLMSFIFLTWQQSRPGEDIHTSPSCTAAMLDSVVQLVKRSHRPHYATADTCKAFATVLVLVL